MGKKNFFDKIHFKFFESSPGRVYNVPDDVNLIAEIWIGSKFGKKEKSIGKEFGVETILEALGVVDDDRKMRRRVTGKMGGERETGTDRGYGGGEDGVDDGGFTGAGDADDEDVGFADLGDAGVEGGFKVFGNGFDVFDD
eukprot:TRINITY_DN7636_c0_g1_i1.p2 TRINITY_DN7636_c0_g1~~TRINITY_DN7636_c0_g1_i1.p2  ORF type:complete len:140 (+),score=28.73 TRINITY_DN7636_c0_g1_i1:674-1093(+)